MQRRLIASTLLAFAACEGNPGSPPLPFELLTPAEATATAVTTPTLTWKASPRALSYTLEIATDSAFTAIVFTQPDLFVTTFTLTAPLAAGTVHFWRVTALNDQGSTPSPLGSFATQVPAGSPPAAFVLTEPADLATGVAVIPTFKWAIAPGADTYTIEVATDAAFTLLVVNQAGVTTTTFLSPIQLLANTQHFWRVTAVNVDGSTLCTAPFSFTTTP
jgi:hypothetical protein